MTPRPIDLKTLQPVETKPFDFDDTDYQAACEVPFEFELIHPETERPLGVFISVIGTESATFKNYVRREGNEARRRNLEKQRKGEEAAFLPMEDEESALIRALAACMVGWRTETDGKSEPVIVWGERRLDFTPDNAVEWLTRFNWVRAQINKAAGDVSNFTGRW